MHILKNEWGTINFFFLQCREDLYELFYKKHRKGVGVSSDTTVTPILIQNYIEKFGKVMQGSDCVRTIPLHPPTIISATHHIHVQWSITLSLTLKYTATDIRVHIHAWVWVHKDSSSITEQGIIHKSLVTVDSSNFKEMPSNTENMYKYICMC